MVKQNIYDNEIFFNGYSKIRENENNANNMFEKPALFSLLPTLKNKTVLDLGCGYGEHCIHFVEEGAKRVVGIDISQKMLAIAKAENAHQNISYLNMPMEDIGELQERFDIVVSSLAFHYVEDFKALINNIYRLLNDGGVLAFSQEHPINTCFSDGSRWTKNKNGKKLFANISNYSVDGERDSTWFVERVKKYHRTFSTIINTLIEAGFQINKLIEPVPTPEILKEHPEYNDLLHKPDFLLIKATKGTSKL
ncbi:MAG: class I SAM-dependent methyltransferase [Ruminococcus sp.]|nr:class I SAM-dependent methyltransferase [Ruminococcus sp.]